MLARTWRDADWRQAARLLLASVPGVLLGGLVLALVDTRWLLVGIGALVLAGLALVAAGRPLRALTGRPGPYVAGAGSGFMNVTAGVGGPMLALYGLSNRWARPRFVGTAQVFFLGSNGLSLAVKGVPGLEPAVWIGALVALAAGVVAGQLLYRLVPERAARFGVFGIAAAGALATLVHGVVELLAATA